MEVGDKVFDELRESYEKVLEAVKKSQDEEVPVKNPGEESSITKFEEAREFLEEMRMRIERIQEDVEHRIKIKCLLSPVHQDMSILHTGEENVQNNKENAMKKFHEILENYGLKPEDILIFMNASNQLYNFLWELEEREDAKLIAHKANTSNEYKKE